MKRSFLAVLLILSSFPGALYAYVSPGAPSGYVNDFAGMLSPEEKGTIESALKDFHDRYGGEIAVVTVDSLGGDDIEHFANELYREWGIGSKEKNDGALLLVAKQDRALRIEVGYGYEGTLTDAKSSEIVRNVITPRFKEGAYGLGLMEGVRDIIATLAGESVPFPASTETKGSSGFDLGSILPFFFFGVAWLGSVLGRSKSWWLGGLLGAATGLVIAFFTGLFTGVASIAVLGAIGLLFDYLVSKRYKQSVSSGMTPPWWTGGGGFRRGSSGGGFGGFGGGSSGGGGASGRW